VYVADAGRRGIVALAPDGSARVLAEGVFREPAAVAVLPDDSLVVVDGGAGVVQRLSRDGRPGERLAAEESLFGPRGIGAAADGRIVVADTGNNRLLLVSSLGPPEVIGGLREPTDAAFLTGDELLVAETGARLLTIVRLDGQRVASWVMPDATTVVGPHVAVLPDGGWVATAPDRRAVLRLPAGGSELEVWTAEGDLRKPVGIAVGPTGVVVSDHEAAAVVQLQGQ
jgi:DNA-binding beta-propeller fold protein YncE